MLRNIALLVCLLPGIASAATANGPWGTFPNCIAPAVQVESETWWIQPGDPTPWHLHLGSCMPNARTVNCSDPANPVVTADVPFTVVPTEFNYSGPEDRIEWVRYQIEPSPGTIERRDTSLVNLNEGGETVFPPQPLTFNASEGSGGLDEIRLSPNIDPNRFGNRHFTTLNFEVCTGTGSGHYRSAPDPIGRGWYSGHEYARVSVNYMDFFQGRTDIVRPIVSGVVPLRADHSADTGTVSSLLWLDAHTHDDPTRYLSAVPGVPIPPPHGGMLLYRVNGSFDGTYNWDTRQLADGVHTLLFQTYSAASDGTSVGGLRLTFEVRNGGSGTVGCPGDLNGDGVVGMPDFTLLGTSFGDGVGIADFLAIGQHFGTSCP